MMPTKFRRRIVPLDKKHNIIHTKIKSLTRNDGTYWEQWIDTATGEKRCNCPAFLRHDTCKHLRRAVEMCERWGEVVTGCYLCHGDEHLHEVADEDGNPIPGRMICTRCAHEARQQNNKQTTG